MTPITQSLITLALITTLELAVYAIFLRPRIASWGATRDEATSPLPGDDLAPGGIDSTRAITIDAPINEVWAWIIQLGADRGGFFSYAFIEKALGYEFREADIVPEFEDMPVGRIVPASLDESKSFIDYNFRVTAVDPGKWYVLANWGAFVVREIDAGHTRLIVRTHRQEHPTLWHKIADFFGMTVHYIMERRMLIGFKAQAEAGPGVRLPSWPDNLWLLGLVLSAVGIIALIFFGGGIPAIVLSAVYATLWLVTLLIVDPRPGYSLALLLIVAGSLGWLI
ncbi:MAG: hypothetical protein JXJ17_09120 [Anaerolineae bacterium]|nr:hypothetical protein [Anaerolineae bacterium]